MIDHLVGRPNPSWKRAQVFLVILFWLWRIIRGGSGPPRMLRLKSVNRFLRTSTHAKLSPFIYSPNYYRATWITTGLDAGFATAMSIRPKWLRDICALVFSAYYIAYPNEADEKLRRFRAVPTVEMLRYTWEKTTHPFLRIFTYGPSITMRKKILLPRPTYSTYRRPITCYIYYAHTQEKLKRCTDLILDFPGGGFVAMSPEHHEDRLKMWAHNTGKPVLAKSPDPYPFAIDEAFDTYQMLVESRGAAIGMSGKKLNVVISSDSAGATLAVNVVLKILEHNNMAHVSRKLSLPLPLALVMNYAALDFNFTSWMTEDNLRILRAEQSSGNLPGLRELAEQKDHLKHISPLSMVGERGSGESRRHRRIKRKNSWRETLRGFTTSGSEKEDTSPLSSRTPSLRRSTSGLRTPPAKRTFLRMPEENQSDVDSSNDEDEDYTKRKEEDRPLQERVKYVYPHSTAAAAWMEAATKQEELSVALLEADSEAARTMTDSHSDQKKKEPIGVRLTMTSRTGYFQDRIISPSMMRAMAILYIGPHRNPDFTTDYHLSPILAPTSLLAQFPPLLMQCGEKDPFVDDTVIFAGRVREAKRARKIELDLAISGKSARFGEMLRMSSADAGHAENVAALKRERDKLGRENEDDWVQLVLFAEWSHGYLQMAALIPEAKVVIEDLGEWIDDAFLRYSKENGEDKVPIAELGVAKPASPRRVSKSISNKRTLDLLTSETENDDSGITFMAKKEKRTSSNDMGMIDIGGERTDSTKVDPTRPAEANTKTDAEEEKTGEPDDEVESSNVEGIKASSSRQGGQIISESELMRRRRLLDSHIFE
ncbi:Alpha/Beta hydrolase protein [Lentinula boryana]|uniref:Alpha/Beta hydrolase protein n=1 Tax=Lentinula boryana TaxID=40481 RepID=A0ABQ8QST4_9AGAR|nr:Alpha/Beta hydrolase protein [Lentinula boryana]